MQLCFIHSATGDLLIRAFSWTLIHSCWQGLLMAGLAAGLILITRRSGPGLRYHLFSGLFGLFVLSVGVTFVLELRALAKASDFSAIEVKAAGGATSGWTTLPLMKDEQVLADDLSYERQKAESGLDGGFFDRYSNWLVGIWFIFFCYQLIKLILEMIVVQRMRHSGTAPAPDKWQERLMELASGLGIGKGILLLESSRVHAPLVAGILRPVILLPAGLLTGLPPLELEAILLHELAHIRRNDYLVNLMQRFAEVLFFFNPAVRWVSGLIREERENYCDDMAVGKTRDGKLYIHALLSFMELERGGAGTAMAFPGDSNQLLRRAQRIAFRDNKTLNVREKFMLVTGMFVAAVLTVAFSRATEPAVKSGGAFKAPGLHNELSVETPGSLRDGVFSDLSYEPFVLPGSDTTATPVAENAKEDTSAPADVRKKAVKEAIIYAKLSKEMDMQMKKISEENEKMQQLQKKVEEQQQKMLADKAVGQGEQAQREAMVRDQQKMVKEIEALARVQADKSRQMAKQMEELIKSRASRDELSEEREKELAKLEARAAVDQEQKGKDIEIREKELEAKQKAEAEFEKDATNKEKEAADKEKEIADKEKFAAERERNLADKQKDITEKERNAAMSGKVAVDKAQEAAEKEKLKAESERKLVNRIVQMMLDQKLITNTDLLSFSLDKEGMIVNGVKQPKEVFRVYREQFINKPNDRIVYLRNHDMETISTSLYDNK